MMCNVIKSESEYEAALARIDEIFDAEPDTDAGKECDLLCTLVEKYEDEHYPIPKPTPIGAIEYTMEKLGLTRNDLAPLLGGKSNVSAVLSGKRTLNLFMASKLNEALGIPIDVLVQPSTVVIRRTNRKMAIEEEEDELDAYDNEMFAQLERA